MFISEAWAQAADGGLFGGGLGGIVPLILIFVVFYFLLIRPQQKKMKEHQMMVGSLGRGDKVITGGGLHGTVTKVVNDAEVMVEIAEGIRVRVARPTITAVTAKKGAAKDAKAANDGGGTPAKEAQGGSLIGKLMGKK